LRARRPHLARRTDRPGAGEARRGGGRPGAGYRLPLHHSDPRNGDCPMKISLLRLWNITKVGLMAISRNKMRSLLTMLGIIIGVGCVITMVAVGTGASSSIQATINSLGTNFIMLFPRAATTGGAPVCTDQSKITPEDADAIKAERPAVSYVSPGARTNAQIVAGELNWGTQVWGAGVDWPFIRAWNVADGDFFTDVDVRTSARVCVLGATV